MPEGHSEMIQASWGRHLIFGQKRPGKIFRAPKHVVKGENNLNPRCVSELDFFFVVSAYSFVVCTERFFVVGAGNCGSTG